MKDRRSSGRLEQQLREARAIQNGLMDNLPIGIALVRNRKVAAANLRLAQMTGISQHSLQGLSSRIMYPSDEAYEAAGEQYYQQLSHGQRVETVLQLTSPSGLPPFWCRLIGVALDPCQADEGTLWMFEQLPDQQKAQDDLVETKRSLETIIDFLPDPMMALDAQGRIVAWNMAMEQMTNVSALEMVGQGQHAHALALHGERRPMLIDLVMGGSPEGAALYPDLRKEGKCLSAETTLRLPRSRGGPRLGLGTATAVYDANGRCAGAIETIRDVTEQRQAEERFRSVFVAKEAAEAAARSKSEFLAHMSHEIRTPMNAILGLSHLALQTGLDSRQRSYVSRVHRSAQNLLGIIDNILDFSKFEAGRLELEHTGFALEEVLDNVEAVLGPQVQGKGLELSIQLDPGAPRKLVGDPMRLGQVLINLVGNALKFSDRGQVLVRVQLDQEAGGHVFLRFSVQDSGIGISAEQLAKLFHPFSQADSSITRQFGGTGLGLSICKHLVELMGGSISVDSQPGRGSTFSFVARFERPESAAPGAAELHEQPEGAAGMLVPDEDCGQPALGGALILVVDDNEINQEVAKELLEQAGASVALADNGEEALQFLESRRPDLVLMDLQMPVMDGLEATRRIRADGRFFDLPILAMTAHVMKDEQLRSLAAGMDDHVTKPVDPVRLIRTVAAHLKRNGFRCLPASSAIRPAPVAPGPGLDGQVRAGNGFQDLDRVLDSAAALARLNGNRDSLARLLKGFLRDLEQAPQELRQLMEAGQLQPAFVRAHTLKGAAGNLGLGAVHTASARLEGLLRQGTCAYDVLGTLSAAMAEARSALEAHFAAEGGPGEVQEAREAPAAAPLAWDLALLAQRLEELRRQLEEGDFGARSGFGELKALPGPASFQTLLLQLEAPMASLDFDEAAALAGAWLRQNATSPRSGK